MHRAIVHRSTTGGPSGALYESPRPFDRAKGKGRASSLRRGRCRRGCPRGGGSRRRPDHQRRPERQPAQREPGQHRGQRLRAPARRQRQRHAREPGRDLQPLRLPGRLHHPARRQPTKTEPDQNTYLVTRTNPGGPTAGYDYGHHFLIQGHENGGAAKRATSRGSTSTSRTRAPHHAAQPAGRPTRPTAACARSTAPPTTRSTASCCSPREAGNAGGVFGQPLQLDRHHRPGGRATTTARWARPATRASTTTSSATSSSSRTRAAAAYRSTATTHEVKQPNSFVFRFVPQRPAT